MTHPQDMPVKAIAPWFGSNRMLAQNVADELGVCDWIGIPFVGGMAELPKLRARTIVANDVHRHVINLARAMKDPALGPALYRKLRRYVLHPDAVIVAQQRCELREREFDSEAELFGNDRNRLRAVGDVAPDLLWAEDYFVSAWGSRSHTAGSKDEFSSGMSIRWTANGGDSAVRFHNAVRSIPAWRKALKNTSFTTLDGLEFLGKCRDVEGHGIYCDPPFPGAGDRYKYTVDAEYQAHLAERAASFDQARVVMRFYDHDLIRRLYPQDQWTWLRFRGRTQANKDAPEILIINGPSYANRQGLLQGTA